MNLQGSKRKSNGINMRIGNHEWVSSLEVTELEEVIIESGRQSVYDRGGAGSLLPANPRRDVMHGVDA